MTKITEEAQQLFRESIGTVTPLRHVERVLHKQPHHRLKQRLRQRRFGVPKVWFSECETKETVSGLVDSNTHLIYQRHALAKKQFNALIKGHFSTRCVVDLHGLTEAQAETKMQQTLQRCHWRTDRYLLIIHGKGRSNDAEHPVLKNWLNWWLRNQTRVIAFHTAQLADGGSGALYVLLASADQNLPHFQPK